MYCSISKCFFKLYFFFPPKEINNDVLNKRCLLNKHSLFLYLFLVHMNIEIQTGMSFEYSRPYSNTEFSSVCAVSRFDGSKTDL